MNQENNIISDNIIITEKIQFAPFRSVGEFITKSRFGLPTFSDLPKWNIRVLNNLLYFQTNYFAIFFLLFFFTSCFYAQDVVFGFMAVAIALLAFVLSFTQTQKIKEFRTLHPYVTLGIVVLAAGCFISQLAYVVTLLSFVGVLLIPTVVHASLCLRSLSANLELQPILDALSSEKDPLMIENALFSLRSLAFSDTGRKCFYTLSSPGYHPRGWKQLLKVVCHFVELVRGKLETATFQSKAIQQQQQNAKLANLSANISRGAKLQISHSPTANSTQHCTPNVSFAAANPLQSTPMRSLFDEKQCFFLPPTLNPRSYEYFGKSKRVSSLLSFFSLPPVVSTMLSRVRALFVTPEMLLSTFETKCAVYAIQAISSVVSHSLKEDRFGVVQKDLRMVITLLTGLSATIDAYVRTSKLGNHNYYDRNVFVLDFALVGALKEIYAEFQTVLGELNLPPNELEIFETLTTN